MEGYLDNLLAVTTELAPWLFLGLGIAGILHVVVPRSLIRRHLGTGPLSVVKASVIGVPLPLCSCGVIPTALGLKKDGAGDGAAVSFLISTPQTGVDSILVAASFLGWPFAVYKVVAALVTGVFGGWATQAVQDEPDAETAVAAHEAASWSPREALDYAFNDLLRMIWRWLVFGIVVSAAITTWVPTDFFAGTAAAAGALGLLMALAISLPLYVCATSSVPIAAALVHAGLPPGAALVFLMAGPATNLATVGAVYKGFGKKAVATYLVSIIGGSLLFGWAFDGAFDLGGVAAAHHMHTSTLASVSAVALVASFGWFAAQEGRDWLSSLRPAPAATSLTLPVEGMSCMGCVGKVQRNLLAHDSVDRVEVDLEGASAQVWGSQLDRDQIVTVIRDAGFATP